MLGLSENSYITKTERGLPVDHISESQTLGDLDSVASSKVITDVQLISSQLAMQILKRKGDTE